VRPLRRSAGAATVAIIALGLGTFGSGQTPAPPPRLTPQTPAPPAPQTPPPPADQQRPTFRTGANLVRVDVYPTRDGKLVTDLLQNDFEVFEDGKPQKIESFEQVIIAPPIPQEQRIEPSSQREMQQAVANPRNRVFVIFLDQTHVPFEASHAITEPLIRLINRIIGPDDLVGVMTPDMAVTEVVYGRRTEVTEERLRTHWHWGDRMAHMTDEREEAYQDCYPPPSTVAGRMIVRRRERVVLDALDDLVKHLNGMREERKAIITVSGGWDLFRPDHTLLDPASNELQPVPKADPYRIGPDGRPTKNDPNTSNRTLTLAECATDRQMLAYIEDDQYLRDIINEANRSNATFYPIDPRGLVVFETPINENVNLNVDAKVRRARRLSLQDLADGTDGIGVFDTNNLDEGLRRISDDLTSYYLLGYYSSNTKLDGGYRSVKVRVTRPGIDVRARRGYRAATAAEMTRAREAAATPAAAAANAAPVQAALTSLAGMRPDSRLRLRATSTPLGDVLWIAGELPATSGRPDEWSQGATADLQISAGAAKGTARVTMKPGERNFLTSVTLAGIPDTTAEIDLKARVAPAGADGGASLDAVHFSATPQPLYYRRGPTTGNRQVPTADLRYTRAERAHLELPVAPDTKPGSARLLDRSGQPLTLPVTVGERTEESTGQRWITADVVLAPLAAADYIIELTVVERSGEARIVSGLRVTR
jgi:VWFA-related protein